MQQPCQRCGYISDRPARFCRQCGAPLFAENEATSATTRRYAPQQPVNPYDAPYQSQLAQGFRRDDQTPDTSSLYGAPAAPRDHYYPANYQYPEPRKSSALKWALITLLCVALVSVGIGVMVISAIRVSHNSGGPAPVSGAPAETGSVPSAPQAPPAPGELPDHLEQYKYPNATVDESVKALGNEVIKMTTTDSVTEVSDFYKKQLGDPMLKTNNEDGEKVVFHVPGSPTTIITINQDDKNPDKTQIVVLRSRFQIPKMN